MIEFKRTMDPHSLLIERDGKSIGHLLWHKDREPKIRIDDSMGYLTLDETELALKELKRYTIHKNFYDFYDRVNSEIKELDEKLTNNKINQ